MLMALSPHDGGTASPASVSSSTPRLTVHAVGDARRTEVEGFIRDVFARRYGADVRSFTPKLVTLQDRGEIVAAAGYRSAAEAPLFLERYLPSPVEALLASEAEAQPERKNIVEVGHLAASRAGEGRRLISLIGPHLAAQDFTWVVGTITTELRHLFMRIGVTPLALGIADPAALGREAVQWGSYYDHRPVVLAGHLNQALRRLARKAQSSQAGQ
ncbi:MAG: thermostable hemolysin [Steroidobacteraceae bacterium]